MTTTSSRSTGKGKAKASSSTRKRSRTPRRPRTAAEVLSPEVRWYLTEYTGGPLPGIGLPDTVPQGITPEPRDHPGAYFDPERVDRAIRALMRLKHTKGRWAGRPIKPEPWQVAYIIAPVFGWVAPNDEGRIVRIIREVYVEVPRKNGKTTLVSGLGLVLGFADGEKGAEVLMAAASKDQAKAAFAPAKQIAEQSPMLKRAGITTITDRIERRKDGSAVQVVSSVGDLQHGKNPNGAVVDELHVHKSPDLVDAIESGAGARDQPLYMTITTAGTGAPGTVYDDKRRFVDKVISRSVKAPTQWAVVFAADETDDPFAESTWRKSNPNYGVSVSREFLAAEVVKAKASPTNLARFQRLHLGMRTRQLSKYIPLELWDRNAGGLIDEAALAGRKAFGGLDLASVSDLTALCWLLPVKGGRFDVVWRAWVPEETLPELDKRTANNASAWVKAGWLQTTPGDVTDYEYVKAQVKADAELFDVQTIGFDPWNASQITNDLIADGLPMVKVRQGYLTLSPPTKEVLRLLKVGKRDQPGIRHGGNPLARWCVDNLAVAADASGNVKPDKGKASDKIDLVAAMVTAMAEALATDQPAPSAYEDSGMMVV